jgi:antitoxin (DNA-binding transcriptional repressor) of toxin-antitoxin stability system
MLKKTFDVREPQTSLQDILSLVRNGDEVVLTEGANPLARVVPIARSSVARVAGLHNGTIWTSDDFDEPLPEDYWTQSV